jgi:hypothetical protein
VTLRDLSSHLTNYPPGPFAHPTDTPVAAVRHSNLGQRSKGLLKRGAKASGRLSWPRRAIYAPIFRPVFFCRPLPCQILVWSVLHTSNHIPTFGLPPSLTSRAQSTLWPCARKPGYAQNPVRVVPGTLAAWSGTVPGMYEPLHRLLCRRSDQSG